MILIESYPINSVVKKYVDRYQLYVIKENAYLKTVPNGKIELYFIKSGAFEAWGEDSNSFRKNKDFGFMPATAKTGFYRIPEHLLCLNVKINLNALSLPFFDGFLKDPHSRLVSEFIPEDEIQQIISLISEDQTELPIDVIDDILKRALKEQNINHEVVRLIELMEGYVHEDFRVTTLSDQMNMSPKTLERLTKKHFNLTPKNLWKVIRFEQATSHIKNSSTQKLIDSLAYGFYDQSHFIKECKKVTGYSPREFFSKLKLSTNDLIFENEKKPN